MYSYVYVSNDRFHSTLLRMYIRASKKNSNDKGNRSEWGRAGNELGRGQTTD